MDGKLVILWFSTDMIATVYFTVKMNLFEEKIM